MMLFLSNWKSSSSSSGSCSSSRRYDLSIRSNDSGCYSSLRNCSLLSSSSYSIAGKSTQSPSKERSQQVQKRLLVVTSIVGGGILVGIIPIVTSIVGLVTIITSIVRFVTSMMPPLLCPYFL